MSFTFSVNQFIDSTSVTAQASSLFSWKEALKTSGWTVISSSNGTSSSGGDILLTSASLNNSWVWFTITAPNSRSLGVQVYTGSILKANPGSDVFTNVTKIKYSPSQQFSTFTGSATIMPSSIDEFYLIGNSLNNLSTGSFLPFWPDAKGYAQIVTGDSNSQYTFAFWATKTLANNLQSAFVFDLMQLGTCDSQDSIVFYIDSNKIVESSAAGILKTNFQNNSSPYTLNPPITYFNNQFVNIRPHAPQNFWLTMDINPVTGKDLLIPVMWSRHNYTTVPYFVKGISSIIQIPGASRNYGDLLSINSTGDYIYVGYVVFPWNNTTILV